MIRVPPQLDANSKFEAALDLCYEVMLTNKEVARHLRITPQHLRMLRHKNRGPGFLKFPSGAVMYRMSEVLRYCDEAQRIGATKRNTRGRGRRLSKTERG